MTNHIVTHGDIYRSTDILVRLEHVLDHLEIGLLGEDDDEDELADWAKKWLKRNRL